MAVKKVGNQWAVVKKNGKLGKGRFTSAATAQAAQTKGRNLARKNPLPKGGSKPSNVAFNPSGGAKSSSVAKIGVIFRRARTALNITAPGWGSFRPGQSGIDGELEGQLARAGRRYSGHNFLTGDTNFRHVIPTVEGIGVSITNDWFDRKMRNSARISRGKLFPILSEALPLLRARFDAVGAVHPLYEAARNYNKRTTGYDPTTHTHAFSRVEEYAAGKILVAGYNKVVPPSWKRAANSVFPKGVNPF